MLEENVKQRLDYGVKISYIKSINVILNGCKLYVPPWHGRITDHFNGGLRKNRTL